MVDNFELHSLLQAVQQGDITLEQLQCALRESDVPGGLSASEWLRKQGLLTPTIEATSAEPNASREGIRADDVLRVLAASESAEWAPHSTLTETPLVEGSLPKDNVQRGRYLLREPLGSGGMGIVWRADDPQLGRQVALKELKRQPSAGSQATVWIREEAQTAGRLEHPGIVPVYEVVEPATGAAYYTMRLVEGQTLSEAIQELHAQAATTGPGTAQLNALLRKFIAVCQAVGYANSKGVVHRDLKGANVKLGPFDDVQVLDWGLARTRSEDVDDDATPADGDRQETIPGTRKGTPAYMAPEQARGDSSAIDARTDVYGLGAVMYELLTGRSPFPRPDQPLSKNLSRSEITNEICRQVMEAGPVPPRELASWIPKPLAAICEKAMSRDKEQRYQSATALAEDVVAWLDDRPAEAYPDPWTTRARRWIGRHRTLVSSAVSVLLVAAVLLSVGLVVINNAYEDVRSANNVAERSLVAEQRARTATEQVTYSAQIRSAQQLWENGRLDEAHKRLRSLVPKEGRPDFRGWEWQQLNRLCIDADQRTIAQGAGSIEKLAMSPDGAWLVISIEASSPFAAKESPTQVEIWNVAQRKRVAALDTPTKVEALAFSPKSPTLVTGDVMGTVRQWSTEDWRMTAEWPAQKGSVTGLAFSSDDRWLVSTGTDDEAHVWRVSSHERSWSFGVHAKADKQQIRRNVAFVPNSSRCVVFSSGGNSWFTDVERQNDVSTIHFGLIGAADLDVSPDGKQLVLGGSQGGVQLVDAQTGGLRLVVGGQTGLATQVRFLPGGKSFASAGVDHTIRIWSAANGQLLTTLRGHRSSINSMAVGSDGRLVTGDAFGRVLIWEDPMNPPERRSLRGFAQPIVDAAPLPGQQVLVALGSEWMTRDNGPGTALLVDLKTGRSRPVSQRQGETAVSATLSPDGKLVVTGSDAGGFGSGAPGELRVWDVSAGTMQRSLGRMPGMVGCVKFSRDGRQLVAIGGSASRPGESQIEIWDAVTWQRTQQIPAPSGLASCAEFSPDGHMLAVASFDLVNPQQQGGLRFWDVVSGHWMSEMIPLSQNACWLRFTENGKQVVVATGTIAAPLTTPGRVQAFAVPSGAPGFGLEDRSLRAVLCAAVNREGTLVATASADGLVQLWDTQERKVVRSFHGHSAPANWVEFSPDGKQLATSSNSMLLGDASGKGEVIIFDVETATATARRPAPMGGVMQFEFTKDGQQLVAVCGDAVHLWQSSDLADVRSFGYEHGPKDSHQKAIYAVAASPDGQLLATAGEDRSVKLWETENLSRARTLTGHTTTISDIAFSPDGKFLASVGGDRFWLRQQQAAPREVILWDTSTNREHRRWSIGETQTSQLAFCENGQTLAVSISGKVLHGGKPEVRLYDVATGNVRQTFAGSLSGDVITAMAVSSDGKWLAFGTFGEEVWLASLTESVQPQKLTGHQARITSIGFSPDSKTLVAADGDGYCSMRQASPVLDFPAFFFRAHDDAVHALMFHPDTSDLLTSATDIFPSGELRIWLAWSQAP